MTLDLSYVEWQRPLHSSTGSDIAADADLITLVKPMFELRLARAPTDHATVAAAVARAERGLGVAGWEVAAHLASPVAGSRGACEALVHARRR